MRSSGHRKSENEHYTTIRGILIPLWSSPPTPWTSPFSNGQLWHCKTATTIPICNPSRLVPKFQISVRAAQSTSPLPQTPLWKSFWIWIQKNEKTGCSHKSWFEVVNQCVRPELPEILWTLRHEVLPTPNQTSFATFWIQNSGDLFTLQKQMFHLDLSMTKRYTDISNTLIMDSHKNHSHVNLLLSSSRRTTV